MNPKNVLVVDDSRTIVAILRDMLKTEGYAVRCAYSGEEALDLLKDEQPDLMILDVLMPNMNGLQVLSTIKGCGETSSVPVIMLTSSGKHDDILEGYKLGADYYITKPFRQTELMHGIELVLGREKRSAA